MQDYRQVKKDKKVRKLPDFYEEDQMEEQQIEEINNQIVDVKSGDNNNGHSFIQLHSIPMDVQ